MVGAGERLYKKSVMAIQVRGMLVPMVFSGHSRRALTFADKLANDLDAEAGLLHVVESPP